MRDKIGSLEALSLLLVVVLNHVILSLPKNVIAKTGSSSLLNIIFVSILAFLFMMFIVRIFNKFPGHDILNISSFIGGKFLKYLTGILFLIYFISFSSITLRNFAENLKIIYFQNYSITLILFLFILAIIGCNYLGIKSIARGNFIVLPVLFLSIIFIFFATMKNFNYQDIFPILGDGFYSTFISGMSNIYAYSAIAVFYFLPKYVEYNSEIKRIGYSFIIISFILLLFSIATVLLIFPVISNAEQIAPLYLAARLIEFGRFFQRVDAIFLLVWIISVVSYLSFIFALSINIFKDLFNLENSNMLICSWTLLCLGVSLIPKNLVQIRFFTNVIYRNTTLGLVYLFGFIILFLANIKLSKKNKKERGNIK